MSPEYLTVSELTRYLKYKFDQDPYLRKVYVTGEISNFRLRPSHQYFSLKDQGAVLSATMFQSAFKKIRFQPKEGMKVLVTGTLSIYDKDGRYQIIIDHMEPDGVGALYQAYQDLKDKLAKEGLFDLPKKPIPFFPRKIAILTSESGAVIQDIQTTIKRRFPIVQMVLFPTVVQGPGAVPSILANLEAAQEGDFDLVIIGRGGGSIEDLWAFNEEAVVRKVAAFPLPLISSVGHETDTTLIDFVADRRAPTPTAAAEMATPVLSDLLYTLSSFQHRLESSIQSQFSLKGERLKALVTSSILARPQRLYQNQTQDLDRLMMRLDRAWNQNLQAQAGAYQKLHHRLSLQSPQNRLAMMQQANQALQNRLALSIDQVLKNKGQVFQRQAQALDHLSPLKIMGRGYTLVQNQQGLVKSLQDLEVNQVVSLTFKDGQAKAVIQEMEKE